MYRYEVQRGEEPALKEFACAQVVPDCNARFQADTEGQVGQHAKEAHGIDEISPQVADQVRAGITDRPAA